jgi:hypothetical protein
LCARKKYVVTCIDHAQHVCLEIDESPFMLAGCAAVIEVAEENGNCAILAARAVSLVLEVEEE